MACTYRIRELAFEGVELWTEDEPIALDDAPDRAVDQRGILAWRQLQERDQRNTPSGAGSST
jgi:hypothetical protein